MKRGGPMKRTPFKSRAPARPEREDRPLPTLASITPACFKVAARIDGLVRAAPKEDVLQNEAYMALVRLLACAHCRVVGFTQLCHADEGKGQGIKTDCRRAWPGCGPHGDTMGCHYLLGSTGKLGKEERRRLEEQYGRQTRAEIRARGLWPKSLPPWPGDEPANDGHFAVVASQ